MFVIVWNMGHHGMVTDFSVIMNYKTIVTMVGNNKKGFDLNLQCRHTLCLIDNARDFAHFGLGLR